MSLNKENFIVYILSHIEYLYDKIAITQFLYMYVLYWSYCTTHDIMWSS